MHLHHYLPIQSSRLCLSRFYDSPDTLLNHPQTSYEYALHLFFLIVPYGTLWVIGVVCILGFQIYKNPSGYIAITLEETTHYINPSADTFFHLSRSPTLFSIFSLLSQAVLLHYAVFQSTYIHPVMVDFIICFLVIIKCWSQISVICLHFVHYRLVCN